jgi:hypothetical protein
VPACSIAGAADRGATIRDTSIGRESLSVLDGMPIAYPSHRPGETLRLSFVGSLVSFSKG